MPTQDLLVRFLGDTRALAASVAGVSGILTRFLGPAALIGATAGVFKLGESFDDAFDTIRVGTGKTGAVLDGLKADFKEVLKDVPTDFGSAGTAIADLNRRLGLTGTPLQDMAAQLLDLSRITKTDLGTNIEAVSKVFQDFGVGVEEQGPALDSLFRASQASGIEVAQLANTMKQFGAPLRQLGFGFEETAALVAKFDKEGVNTEAVMAGMKKGLGGFAKAGEEPREAFARLVETMKNAPTDLEALQLAIAAFGQRAGPDLASAVREGRFELGEILDVVVNGKDTIREAAEDAEDFGEKWLKIRNRVFVALEPVATALFDAVGVGMDVLADIVTDVQEAFERFKPVILSVAGIIALVLIPNWIRLGVIATANAAKAVAAWFAQQVAGAAAMVTHIAHVALMVARWAFLGAQSLLHAAKVAAAWLIAMGPIGLVIAAVVALVALIIANWETVKAVTAAVWDAIRRGIEVAWGVIRAVFEAVLGGLRTAFDVWSAPYKAAWNLLWGGLSAVVGGVSGAIGTVIAWFVAVKDWLASNTFVTAAFDIIKGVLDVIVGVIKDVVAWIDKILGALGRVAKFIVGGGGGSKDPRLGNLFRGGLFSGGFSAQAGGFVPGALGTPVPIMAHAGEFVLSRPDVDRLLRGGGRTIHIEVHGVPIREFDEAQAVRLLRHMELLDGRVAT